LIAYVRGLLLADPAPALHGVGLAMVVLNAVMFALLGAGIVLGRQKGSPWRGPGIVLLLLAVAAGMALYAIAPHAGGGFFFCMAGLWVLLMRLPLRWGVAVSVLTIAAVGALGEALRPGGADLGLLSAFAGLTLGAVASR